MKTYDTDLSRLFGAGNFFEIPLYQREYQWGPENWLTLWRDLGTSQEDGVQHFFGIVLLERINRSSGSATGNRVIDGQQRLVTLLLLLAAVRDARAEIEGKPVPTHDGLWWVRNNQNEPQTKRISAQEADRVSLDRAMEQGWKEWYRGASTRADFEGSRILWAYTYFKFLIWLGKPSFIFDELELPRFRPSQSDEAVESVWAQHVESVWAQHVDNYEPADLSLLQKCEDAIYALSFVELVIDNDDEDSSTIFDSINAKRTELEQWDFIRNLVFTKFPAAQANEIFSNVWADMESSLHKQVWPGKRANARDAFIYDYLIARGESTQTGQGSINRKRGFQHFRRRLNRIAPPAGTNVDTKTKKFILEDLKPAAAVWPLAISSGQTDQIDIEISDNVKDTIESINRMSSGPGFPVSLYLLEHWNLGHITEDQLHDELRLLENLLARMVVNQHSLSPMRGLTMAMMGSIATAEAPARVASPKLLSEEIGRRMRQTEDFFPRDEDLKQKFESENFYGSSIKGDQLGAIFRGLERQLAGAGAHPLPYGRQPDRFTVEHVFPQSCVNPPYGQWASDMPAEEAAKLQLVGRVNRIGNLTLLTKGVNSSIKAQPFSRKKAVLENLDEDLPHPPLAINQSICSNSSWGQREIDARSTLLFETFIDRWSYPDHLAS